MATYKVLGQAFPTTTAETTLYTTPGATQTIAVSLVICNQTSSLQSFSIAVKPAGAAVASKHYIYFGASIVANDTVLWTSPITLATTDVISVFVGTANTISFNLYGSETNSCQK